MSTYHDNIGVPFYFCRGRSEEVIALYKHKIFLPLHAFSQRVQHVANGGLILRHVTPGDSGRYSVDVTTRDASGTSFTPFHSVILSVTGIRDLIIIHTLRGIQKKWKMFGKRVLSSSLLNIKSKNKCRRIIRIPIVNNFECLSSPEIHISVYFSGIIVNA